MLQEARERLPDLLAVNKALNELTAVCQAFPEQNIHIDLSELRVDNYHTGLLYAAYGSDCHDAVARGGRYDGLGEYFGRARPAAGFSFDAASLQDVCPKCRAPQRLPLPMPMFMLLKMSSLNYVLKVKLWWWIMVWNRIAPKTVTAVCSNVMANGRLKSNFVH